MNNINKGYNPDFLGHTVPLPSFSESLQEDVLERESLSADPSGRSIYRHYHNYTLVMSKRHRTALFAALNINQLFLQKTENTQGWRIDHQVGSENQLNDDYYKDNVWDKGHLAPDAAAGWGSTVEERIAATNDTYFYTNASLQHENFNRDEWKDLESWVRKLSMDATNKLSVITGPIFIEESRPQTIQPPDRKEVRIPNGFFKVLAYIGLGDSLQVQCFVMYQDHATVQDRKGEFDIQKYQVDITKIEKLTQLKFSRIYHQANQFAMQNNDHKHNKALTVTIAAAMVNPKGKDSDNEWISFKNFSKRPIMLQGWKLQDQGGRKLILNNVVLKANATITLHEINPIRLVNTGGSILLYNPNGELVDQVQYTKDLVKEGVAVNFR